MWGVHNLLILHMQETRVPLIKMLVFWVKTTKMTGAGERGRERESEHLAASRTRKRDIPNGIFKYHSATQATQRPHCSTAWSKDLKSKSFFPRFPDFSIIRKNVDHSHSLSTSVTMGCAAPPPTARQRKTGFVQKSWHYLISPFSPNCLH